MEPIQRITAKVSPDLLGAVTSVISQKRGKIVSVDQKGNIVHIVGEIPTAETFDLSEDLRGATAGRAFWGLEFARWSSVPASMIGQVIQDIRKRKGLPADIQKAEDFMD
jgi:elongation factor 2